MDTSPHCTILNTGVGSKPPPDYPLLPSSPYSVQVLKLFKKMLGPGLAPLTQPPGLNTIVSFSSSFFIPQFLLYLISFLDLFIESQIDMDSVRFCTWQPCSSTSRGTGRWCVSSCRTCRCDSHHYGTSCEFSV